MTDPRASALFSKYVEASITVPSVEQAWVLANLTRENVQWPLKDTETSTLGELVLIKTANLSTIYWLVYNLKVDISPLITKVVDRCIIAGYTWDQWSSLLAFCQPRCTPRCLDTNPSGPFVWTPLGRSIYCQQRETTRKLIEYGCRIPLGETLPSWAWEIQIDTEMRRERCRSAVIALIGVGRRSQKWRDLSGLFARELWKDRYHASWITAADATL
jgi:hypothetical protein